MCKFERLSGYQPGEVEWIWKGRILRGGISLFEGPPGIGKSTLIADIAARITVGAEMPDCTPTIKGSVMLVTSEDDPSATILPRIVAAGGDANQILVSNDLIIPDDIERLVATARENGVSCVMIDPFSGHVGASTSNEQAMRRVLFRLRDAAVEGGFGVVLVRHHSKSPGRGGALNAGLGSIGISAFARAISIIGSATDGSGDLVIASAKCNIGVQPASLRFRLVAGDNAASIDWLGETEESSNDILGHSPKPAPKLDAAKCFLQSLLANGPKLQTEIVDLAHDLGVSSKTLERAKGELGVKSERHGFQGPVMWQLPDLEVADDHDVDAA